jgi:phospholipid/cholesterol/gamma-HCH transport system permease protein
MTTPDAIATPQPGNNPDGPSPVRGVLGGIGRRLLQGCRSAVWFSGLWVAVFVQALRPLTWRRTVRREFVHQCYRIGNRTLSFTVLVGALVGLGLVFQSLYWLEQFGQSDILGSFLTLVLARNAAPLLVGLILLGRSGTVMLVELAGMRIGGQVRMLDAQGVDPFLYLVVPRVLATACCSFALTILFLATAFGVGFVPGNALGLTALGLVDFFDLILMAMGPVEFVVIPLKAFCIGYAVALISCETALNAPAATDTVEALIPLGFARTLVAILLISALLTLLTL